MHRPRMGDRAPKDEKFVEHHTRPAIVLVAIRQPPPVGEGSHRDRGWGNDVWGTPLGIVFGRQHSRTYQEAALDAPHTGFEAQPATTGYECLPHGPEVRYPAR